MTAEGSELKVALIGLGPIGVGIGRLLRPRADVVLVAGVDLAPEKIGRDLGNALEGPSLGVVVTSSLRDALAVRPEVAVLATRSQLPAIASELFELIGARCAVVSTAEELSFPWRRHPDLAAKLDASAKANAVAVIGVGVNPGYVMDLLPIILTAPCPEVTAIRVERVVDASARRLPLQRKIGMGISFEEFTRGAASGTIGHVGLSESTAMIAAAFGWSLDDIRESIEPVMGADGVRGLHQIARGLIAGEAVITLDLVIAADAPPRDEIWISGPLPLHVVVEGGIHGDIATFAIAANATVQAREAAPGLRTVKDLPPVHWRSAVKLGTMAR